MLARLADWLLQALLSCVCRNVAANHLTAEGAAVLAPALQQLTSLQEL
jgi:hypothetical protein